MWNVFSAFIYFPRFLWYYPMCYQSTSVARRVLISWLVCNADFVSPLRQPGLRLGEKEKEMRRKKVYII